MSDGPILIVDERDFRLVRGGTEQSPIYTLEVEDGCDALGQERWRKFETRGSKNLEAVFGYFIRLAIKQFKE